MLVLAGDIGGTKTWLGLFREAGHTLECLAEEKYPSAQHEGLESIAQRFLQSHTASPTHAAFGIAGPVDRRRVRTTNLPWLVDADQLETHLGIRRVRLLNDLEAMAYGIGDLDEDGVVPLHPGQGRPGNAALIAAGTGLGEAGLFWDGQRHRPFPTEGGHAGFSPENGTQRALLEFVAQRHERVSWERVLSGPALPTLLEFVRQHEGRAASHEVHEEMRHRDPSAVVTEAALEDRCAASARALDLFAELYGAEAGNLALKMLARGGVYLGGGIAPKILPKLRERSFLEAFFAKGRMRPLVESMPVKVITNARTPLLGAARRAVIEAERQPGEA